MNKAFTIIELIVVLAIISVSAGAGYITYNNSVQENSLKKEAEDFVNALNSAKEKAIRRDMTAAPACASLRGYDVLLTTSALPHKYQLRFICAGTPDTFTLVMPQYTMKNTNFYNVANGTTIPFYKPLGCLDEDCANTSKTITIQNSNTTDRCITVTVNTVGVISLGEATECT